MGIKYIENNQVKEVKVKVGDNIPVGAEMDYDGTTIPVGWEEVTTLIQVLWTNPNSTQTFAGQTIELSSSNYDYYEILYRTAKNEPFTISNKSPNGLGNYITNALPQSRSKCNDGA